MLVVRDQQMKILEDTARRRFEDEMVSHSKNFTPRLCEVIGDEQLRVALRSAMHRAEGYSFTYRGPIRLFIELMFLCGSRFDNDPQYSLMGDILNAPGDQMQRAEQIHQLSLDYLEKVSGTNNANVRKALTQLLIFARRPLSFPSGFVDGMLDEMSFLFPQKAAYIGEIRLKALIQEGIDEAREYGFTMDRQRTLIVALMFAFGHGCTRDPLYPWIDRTLKDQRIVDPAARAERLERKAVTWLEHVLARPREAPQT